MRKLITFIQNVNRMWWLVGLAVVLALAATMVFKSYLRDQEKNIKATIEKNLSGGPTVEVIAASTNIKRGGSLDSGSLSKRSISADLVTEDMLTVDDFVKIDGAKATRSIKLGLPLRVGDVLEKPKGFSEVLEPGTRAITIEVDEINSMAQMVKPGNKVDLMLIVPDKSDSEGGSRVVMVLQKVKVLATGTSVATKDKAGNTNSNETNSQTGKPATYSNFTFEVTPENAARIALAQNIGKIRAVLRGNDDTTVVASMNSINSKTMLNVGNKQAQVEKLPTPNPVQYIIGGASTTGVINVNVPALFPPGYGGRQTPTGAGGPMPGFPQGPGAQMTPPMDAGFSPQPQQ